jgi:hypothetical protein
MMMMMMMPVWRTGSTNMDQQTQNTWLLQLWHLGWSMRAMLLCDLCMNFESSFPSMQLHSVARCCACLLVLSLMLRSAMSLTCVVQQLLLAAAIVTRVHDVPVM